MQYIKQIRFLIGYSYGNSALFLCVGMRVFFVGTLVDYDRELPEDPLYLIDILTSIYLAHAHTAFSS